MSALKHIGLWCFGSFVWFGLPCTGAVIVWTYLAGEPANLKAIIAAGMALGALGFTSLMLGEHIEDAMQGTGK